MRSFIYYLTLCFDKAECAETLEEKEKYIDLTNLLTPIVKAYCSERGFEVCEQAIQVYGGYGYIQEYPVERLLRDCKITSIYEGTNGIQAMDMLGRKLGMNNGKTFMDFLGEIRTGINNAKKVASIAEITKQVDDAFTRVSEVALVLGKKAMSEKVENAYAFAHPFLEVMGDLTMAWMLLWRATLAAPKLEKIVGNLNPEDVAAKALKNKDAAFYDGQVKTARFFIKNILPITMGKLNAIEETDGAAVEMLEASFGSK